MAERPLEGLTVVEMTVERAGPFCGALLADLGADVVKIERPEVGDAGRWQGPGPDGKSAYFMANNRNKRSVTLDLKSDAGGEAAMELLAEADVFLENFARGVAEKLGVGYDAVAAVNEDIVYASIKGYGETGPFRDKKGLDLILQAEGGIMSVTGPEAGDPVKVGQAIGDLGAGMFAAFGIVSRLWEREKQQSSEISGDEFSGKFDVSLFGTIVSFMNEYLTMHSMTGDVPGTQGRSHQTAVPYQLFETEDSYIAMGVPSDQRWDDFVDALGLQELRQYRTNDDRAANREEVVSAIQAVFETEPTEYWRDRLDEINFPNGPLNDVAEVVDHEQAQARELTETFDDPDWGECILPGNPLHFPDQDVSIRSPAPRLGQHTREVFADVAADQSTVDEWAENGAFGETD